MNAQDKGVGWVSNPPLPEGQKRANWGKCKEFTYEQRTKQDSES